jgi:translation initiation factor eIF-2B subunit delta
MIIRIFSQVISDYETPEGTSLQRHLTTYIGKQIDFLKVCRSLAGSMKTAIRHLKSEISNISIDLPDSDVRPLCFSIFNRLIFPKNII